MTKVQIHMKSKSKIDQLIKKTLDSASGIEPVKPSPFFKDKVLKRMAQQDVESIEGVRYFTWFTPRYQAVALICFVVLNTIALLSYSSENDYGESVENFAEVYGLSETNTDSYLYQN